MGNILVASARNQAPGAPSNCHVPCNIVIRWLLLEHGVNNVLEAFSARGKLTKVQEYVEGLLRQ